jgi:hypothetical protein
MRNRKSDDEIFYEHLFRYDVISKLSQQLQAEMDDAQTTKINEVIAGSKDIILLKKHKEKMEALNIERRLNQRGGSSSYGSESYVSEHSSDDYSGSDR